MLESAVPTGSADVHGRCRSSGALWNVRARSRCGRPAPPRPPRASSRAAGPHSHPPGEQAGRTGHARGAEAARVDGRHVRRIRREPERRHHQDSSRPRGFRERSPLHRDRSEAWLPLSRRRAGAPAWVGVNGASPREQSSLLLQRRRISKLDRRRRTSVEHARPRCWRSWPRRFSPPGCSLPDSRDDRPRRSCGRSRCSPSRCSRGDAPESGKRAGGGDRQATRSPANTHRQTVAARRHRRSARTQSRARSGRTTERGRHANRAAACDRAAYCVHRRRARALGRCRRLCPSAI